MEGRQIPAGSAAQKRRRTATVRRRSRALRPRELCPPSPARHPQRTPGTVLLQRRGRWRRRARKGLPAGCPFQKQIWKVLSVGLLSTLALAQTGGRGLRSLPRTPYRSDQRKVAIHRDPSKALKRTGIVRLK